MWPFNFLLIVWSVTAVASGLSHFFLPAWTAAGTVWPTSAGWQSEVAYFNLLVAAAFTAIARSSDMQLKRTATLAIAALSLVLGVHHLQGWMTEPRLFHIIFTVANFSAALWAAGCLVYAGGERKNRVD